MTETKEKYFTVEEAEKTLPLVKNIVKDILSHSYQIKTIAESMGGQLEGNEEVNKLMNEMNSFMKELEEIGCYYKDWSFDIGLVDFPAVIEGEEVYLCWRSDEDRIRYYHLVSEGYTGRREIPSEYLSD